MNYLKALFQYIKRDLNEMSWIRKLVLYTFIIACISSYLTYKFYIQLRYYFNIPYTIRGRLTDDTEILIVNNKRKITVKPIVKYLKVVFKVDSLDNLNE